MSLRLLALVIVSIFLADSTAVAQKTELLNAVVARSESSPIAELTASDGVAGDGQGFSVAISGNKIVMGGDCFWVGDPDCNYQRLGVVYVYTKATSGWGDMEQTAELSPSDGFPGDGFGKSVAISGDTIVVGAEPHGAFALPGKAYVFVKPVGGWKNMTETAQLSDGSGVDDAFGGIVAIDKTTIVVGAYAAKVDSKRGEGAVFVFEEPPTGWQTTSQFSQELFSPLDKGQVNFGSSISISGNTIVAGGGQQLEEAAVFTRIQNEWGLIAVLERQNGVIGDYFGMSVAMAGNTIAVGAPGVAGVNGRGAVDIFVKPKTGWTDATETAELSVPSGDVDGFGGCVGLRGNEVFGSTIGPVLGYKRPKGGWKSTSNPDVELEGGDPQLLFGYSFAVGNGVVVAGAPWQTVGGNAYQGAAFVFIQ
jgi:hypothetical protein